MRNKLREAFDTIHAEEQLKQKTVDYINNKTAVSKSYLFNRYSFRRIAAVACAVFIVSFAGVSYSQYYTASAYIDLDVNPSLELTMNRFGRIINAYSYNEDGGTLLSALPLKHKDYNEALELLIEEMEAQGYIADEGLLSATLQSNSDKTNEWLQGVQAAIDSSLKAHHSTMEKDIFTVDAETKENAHEHNVSPAKYTAILELQEVEPDTSIEGCRDHSVNDIKKQTDSHHQQNSGEQKTEEEHSESDDGKHHEESNEHEHEKNKE